MAMRAFLGLLSLSLMATLSACGEDDPYEGRSCNEVRYRGAVMPDAMHCTRPDGSSFYTNWGGAHFFEWDGTEPANATTTKPRLNLGRAKKPKTKPDAKPTTTLTEWLEAYEPASEDTQHQDPQRTTCQDVTTWDYNWQNDMLCMRPDGSQFYTDYAGAAAAEGVA